MFPNTSFKEIMQSNVDTAIPITVVLVETKCLSGTSIVYLQSLEFSSHRKYYFQDFRWMKSVIEFPLDLVISIHFVDFVAILEIDLNLFFV